MAHHPAPIAARWFRPAKARPEAPARLFLFPHAGGAATAYELRATTSTMTTEQDGRRSS